MSTVEISTSTIKVIIYIDDWIIISPSMFSMIQGVKLQNGMTIQSEGLYAAGSVIVDGNAGVYVPTAGMTVTDNLHITGNLYNNINQTHTLMFLYC